MRFVWFVVCVLGPCVSTAGQTEEQVDVLRDPWGVPHVFAPTEEAGFFGLGYATAEDRRLQMELVRRKGAGRLAEVFGPEWVQSDRESRIAGYPAWSREALAKLPAEMHSWLAAYAAGVNAWTSAHGEAVACRFQPLGVEPEPWTPADCLLAARAALSLGSPFSDHSVSQYHRFQELVAQGGEAAAEQHLHMAVEEAAAIVSETDMAQDAAAYQRLKNRPRMGGFRLQGTPTDGPKMSHAWAVGGARSQTGKPLLESDPQLPLSTPPFFYEFHLSAGPIDARGLGIPGCPGLFIGFNRHIAWGASALGTGSHAVFLEKLTADGQSYLFAGQAEPFTRRLERIRVKDGADVVQEVLGTRHGVVFNSLSQTTRPGEAHVLYDPQTIECGTTVRAMLAFLTAGNWTEFRAAMEHYYDPGLHIVYADDQNNIGYQTLVHRPLTVRTPRMAQEGWTGQQEITGRIPLDELPHMLNPAQGFISHANNMPVGTWYPFDLGLGTGGNGHTGRSWRLQQLLTGTHLYGVEDFEASVHRDAVNPLLTALLPIAIKVADEDQVEDATVQRLIHAVRGWDLRAETRTDYPAVAALSNVLTPYRGSGLNDLYGAGMGGVTNLARRLSADFARDGATPRGDRERAYLKRWLQASAQGTPGRGRATGATDDWTARMRQGAPEATGRTITIPYQSMIPLQLPKIDPALDIVSPPLTCLDAGTIWSQPGNVYTHIVDLAEIDNSRAMIAPGNCEDAASPLRTAGIELWVQGRTRPAPLSRDKVEQLRCSTTRLEVQAYDGPPAPPMWTVDQPGPGAQLVAAIPAVVAAPDTVPARPRPAAAQKPDDPQLEAAFRVILRASGTSNEEVDAQLAKARKYVEGKPELIQQLRGAAVLGIYLIEESAAGRLKVPYGSPYVLTRLRELLRELDLSQ
jgi:penicillin amidase